MTPASVDHPATICQVPTFPDPIPGIIPYGSISLLAGAPSIGKTALISTILRSFRDHHPIFGHEPAVLPALGFINADRGWAGGAGAWFERAGYPDIRRYSMADDPTFDPKRLRRRWHRTDLLFEFIDKLKLPPYSLITVDPIALFLGGNLLDYDSCAVACHEIRAHLRTRFLTMLATAHSSKLRTKKEERYLRLQDQILGSTAIFGFTDTQMYLASPQEISKPYYSFLWQSHLAPAETFELGRDEQGLFVPWKSAADDTTDIVLACFPLNGEPLSFATLCELAVPYARRTVKRCLDVLVDQRRIEHVEHGLYRRLIVH